MLNKKKILNQVFNNEKGRVLTEEEEKALKCTFLTMTQDIDKVCRKHGLKLFLVGGSLLGAVRHGGFIPWDDDMDFGMIRDDYKKFVRIFDKELGDKYYLRCPNSPYPNGNRFMQIFKKGTTLVTAEGGTPLQPKCVSIDIFPYDYVPNNRLVRIVKGVYCNLIMLIAASVTDYKYQNAEYKLLMMKSQSGKILYYAEHILGLVFSWRTPAKWFNTVDKVIQSKNKTDYITSATGRKHYLGEVFPKQVFFPLQELKFEEVNLYAPANPDTYLGNNYGDDYMTLPAKNKRESHFVTLFDLTKEVNG